jgi:hypothetical protein
LDLKITFREAWVTAEHNFLIDYQLDSVLGFSVLLVPEATSVDQATRTLLQSQRERSVFKSNIL